MRTRKRGILPVVDVSRPKRVRNIQPLETRGNEPFLVGNSAYMSLDYLPHRAEVIKHFLLLTDNNRTCTSNQKLIACSLGPRFR